MERPEYTEVVKALATYRFTPVEFASLNERQVIDLFNINNNSKHLVIDLKEQPKLRFIFDSTEQTEFHLFIVSWTLFKPNYPSRQSPIRAGTYGNRWTDTGMSIQLFKEWLKNEV